MSAVEDLKAVDVAWAAGFFDGEGSVSLNRTGPEGYLYLLVMVSNKDTRGLAKLHNMFGGVLHPNDSRGCHRWSIRSRQAETFLQTIAPFCVQKGDAIGVALSFQKTVGPPGTRALPPGVTNIRQDLRNQLHTINRAT